MTYALAIHAALSLSAGGTDGWLDPGGRLCISAKSLVRFGGYAEWSALIANRCILVCKGAVGVNLIVKPGEVLEVLTQMWPSDGPKVGASNLATADQAREFALALALHHQCHPACLVTREQARAAPCPTCGAMPDECCIGARGRLRASNHISRVFAAVYAIHRSRE